MFLSKLGRYCARAPATKHPIFLAAADYEPHGRGSQPNSSEINNINAALLDHYPNEKMEISGGGFRVRRDFQTSPEDAEIV